MSYDDGFWNYRVIKRETAPGEFDYGVYEVYYDEAGKPVSCTETAMTPTCESESELHAEIELLKDSFKGKTLLYSDFKADRIATKE